MLNLIQGRSCGECKVCCVTPAIDEPAEIAHPKNTPCVRLGENGCSRYDARPKLCRDYTCLWIDGFGDEEYRPDRLGAVFHVGTERVESPDGNGLMDFVAVNEVWDGALEGDTPARLAAKEMGFQVPVMVQRFDGRSEVYSPAQIQLIRK